MKKLSVLTLLIGFLFLSLSCQSKSKPKLYIFNWTDYIAPELIEKFKQENNCEIIYDMYNSNENMLTKVTTSQAMYDIIVPSGDHLEIMKAKGLLNQIDKSKIPNLQNLDPVIMQKARQYDPTNEYGIPYFWGTSGFVYNKKYLSEEQMADVSWDIIGDTLFNGKNVISMLDDAREVVGAALIYSGFTPNTLDSQALLQAETALLRWDTNISHYDSDSYKNEIQDGTVWIAHSYNGDALQIIQENPQIGFTLPKEGSTLWIDFMVIPEQSENKELAYKFINFMLEPENSKENALYVQYATPNIQAIQLLPDDIKNNKFIYPDSVYLNKCHLINNIGEGVLQIDQIWQRIRNN